MMSTTDQHSQPGRPARSAADAGDAATAPGAPSGRPPRRPLAESLVDAAFLVGLLCLTFLLGCFLNRDTDVWWHLKAGQAMLAGGGIPAHDSDTFAAAGSEWINLHWGFQLALAWLHGRGGAEALTLAAAATGTLAVAIILLATWSWGRPEQSVFCWLPVIVLMSGRFYPRPEMLTLVALAVYLFVLDRADRAPRLLWTLVPVQLLWVNVHALFVLGPVLLVCWLADQCLRWKTGLAGDRRRHLLGATLAVAAACFANPYGWRGAVFPLMLFRRLSSEHDFYGQRIGELVSLPDFAWRGGFASVYLWISLGLLVAGALSFLAAGHSARLRTFRLAAFVLFSWLGLMATRNQPQFAIVAGSVLAWNLRDRTLVSFRPPGSAGRRTALVFAAVMLVLAAGWVRTGGFYRFAGEQRLIGLGEHPFWHAHDAARFVAQDGMPRHIVGFHLGQAALVEFHMRADQRVYVDPRLEVIPRAALEEYFALGRALAGRQPDWPDRLARLPQPLALLVTHRTHHPVEATLLGDPRWRCVWFDAVAGVYVPAGLPAAAKHEIDFAARHFAAGSRSGSRDEPDDEASLGASLVEAGSLLRIAASMPAADGHGARQKDGLLLRATGHASRAASRPDPPVEAWRILGRCATHLYPISGVEGSRPPSPSIQLLGIARARYFLRRAAAVQPGDPETLSYLSAIARRLGDREVLLSCPAPDRAVNEPDWLSLDGAARDRLATQCLLAGNAPRARAIWESLPADEFSPADRLERTALTHLVECNHEAALADYQAALSDRPDSLAARIGLATCHFERGDAAGTLRECEACLRMPALTGDLRAACQKLCDLASPAVSPAAFPQPGERR